MLPLAIALCISPPQDDAQTVEALLLPLVELRAAHDWKGLRERLGELLTTHKGRPEVLLHRPQIVEDLLRSAFWEGREPPEIEEVLSGELERWSPSTGNVKLSYGPDALDDFEVLEFKRHYFDTEGFDAKDVHLHPLPFAGPYTITIRGSRYPHISDDVVPRIFVGWENDEGYLVVPGFAKPEGPVLKRWIPALVLRTVEDELEEVDSANSPAKSGSAYVVKVQLKGTSIAVSVNGRRVLKARKPRDLFGRVGFMHFPRVEEIVLEGKAERSWFDGLVDRAVQEQWLSFCEETEEATLLPEWLHLEERPWEADDPVHDELPGPAAADVERSARLVRVLDILEQDPGEALKRAEAIQEEALRRWSLAIVRSAGGETDEALEHCVAVLAQDPGFLPARRLALDLELALGERKAALERASRLARDEPDDPFGHSRLALLALLDGDPARARSAVLEAARQGAYDGRVELANRMRLRARHGPSWRRSFEHRSEHYVVRSDLDQRTCDEAAHVLETALEHYQIALGPSVAVPEEPFPVHIFSGEASYQAYLLDILLGPAENTAGVYLPHLKQLLIWNVPARESMLQTVRHEGFHQYLDAVAGEAPAWLHEGLAEYWEAADFNKMRSRQAPVREDHRRFLRRREVGLAPLGEFLRQDAAAFQREPARHYAQAWALVYFLRHSTRANRGLLGELLQRLVAREPWRDAVEATFGDVDLEALQGELEEYLRDLR